MGVMGGIAKEVIKMGLRKVQEKSEKKDALKIINNLEIEEKELMRQIGEANFDIQLRKNRIENAYNRMEKTYNELETVNSGTLDEINIWLANHKNKIAGKLGI